MTRRPAAATAALVLLGSACADMAAVPDDILQQITANRALWASKRPSAYLYEVKRGCNCPEEAQGPVRIRVRGIQAFERTYTATGAPVAPSLEGAFPSVDGLFDLLQAAAEADAWYITIHWNNELGFPDELYVDYDGRTINDDVSYTVLTAPSPDPGG